MLLDLFGVACLAAMGFVAVRKWPENFNLRMLIAVLLFGVLMAVAWTRSVR